MGDREKEEELILPYHSDREEELISPPLRGGGEGRGKLIFSSLRVEGELKKRFNPFLPFGRGEYKDGMCLTRLSTSPFWEGRIEREEKNLFKGKGLKKHPCLYLFFVGKVNAPLMSSLF